ncbi:MAG: glycosyltransferase family 2 protein [Desulfatibacillum sp.]|nr:glycosyltransferase family 2 protein [Desulfatibacillum sp.]
MKKFKMLSIVSPAFNEGDNLGILIPEITRQIPRLSDLCASVEWVIADDGSTDNTARVVDSGPEFVRRLVLEHRGMSAALYQGVMDARGEVIATLDADLQNDPADLPGMVAVLASSKADMVCGIRWNRKDTLAKRLASRISNKVRRKVLSDTIQDAGCTLRVFKTTARECCFWPIHGGHRFVGPFAQRQGLHVVQMGVNHRERGQGASHFGVRDRLPEVVRDLAGARWLMSRTFAPLDTAGNAQDRGKQD